MQLIAIDDIGAFAALAFARPDEYLGRAMEITGDKLTTPEIADELSATAGRPVPHTRIPLDVLWAHSPAAAKVFTWANETYYDTDRGPVREAHADLMTFETWLQRSGRARLLPQLDGPPARHIQESAMFIAYVVVAILAIAATAFSGVAALAHFKPILPGMAKAGVPESWLTFPIGTLKTAGALGLLLGLIGVPWIGTAAAIGLVLFFVCAVYTHIRAGDYSSQFGLANGFLILSVATLSLSLASA